RINQRLPEQTQAQSENEAIEEVIVSGSYIRRDNFNLPSPIDVTTEEDLELAGSSDLSDVIFDHTFVYGPDANATEFVSPQTASASPVEAQPEPAPARPAPSTSPAPSTAPAPTAPAPTEGAFDHLAASRISTARSAVERRAMGDLPQCDASNATPLLLVCVSQESDQIEVRVYGDHGCPLRIPVDLESPPNVSGGSATLSGVRVDEDVYVCRDGEWRREVR
ncbi:MAG: hypothetical protein AAF525_15700, partial [Pseudomonadota bacterium]